MSRLNYSLAVWTLAQWTYELSIRVKKRVEAVKYSWRTLPGCDFQDLANWKRTPLSRSETRQEFRHHTGHADFRYKSRAIGR